MAHTSAPSVFKQDGQDKQDFSFIQFVLSILFVFLLLTLVLAGATGAAAESQATPTPTPAPATGAPPTSEPPPMSSFLERLAPPPTVYPPSQADQGAQVYYLVCMVCHGDRGQGLTEDWRAVLDPGDRNCWQSHCHASNHPRDGFKLPEFVPAIIGPGELAPFPTALNLHDYLHARMPWQAPGSLSEDEYWQLTAFLARENGYDLGPLPLDPERAAAISLGVRPTPTPDSPLAGFLESAGIGFWVASGGVLALFVLLVLIAWVRRKDR